MFKNTFFAALLGVSLVSLAGCDAAEQSARDLASKAEQAAQELVQEKLKESVNALNEQLDKAQEKSEALLGQPPKAEDKPEEADKPKADAAAPATVET
jgi:Skp family chaperone for outer membrane proteins